MGLLRVVGGMFSTRYFIRWLLPIIIGIICGYIVGSYVIVLPHCKHRKNHGAKANGHNRNKTIKPYIWDEDLTERVVQKGRNETGFLYVAMMSAAKYLDNRALAAAKTWAADSQTWYKHSNTRIEIFAATEGTIGNVNIVKLPGVADNVYPPQRKSFSMLRHLAEHHIDDYDWFMRLDDDAYISWPILEKLLRRLDPSEMLYIGSPGFGKDDEDYVEEEMTYCMGGPGIVMSRELLRALSPHLPGCLKQLLTEHEDLELGRCIQERLGVSCVRAYEANRLFKQNYDFSTQSNEERLKMFRDIAAGSIATYHPNKQPEQQYQIHNAFKNARIGELVTETATLEQELFKTKRQLNEHIVDNSFINAPESALDRVLNSVNREDTWDQFTGGRYYSEQQTIHKISAPWVENISVGARESAKIIYKQMKLSGRITRIQVPEVYHKLSMEGSDLIGTIIIRHSGYDHSGRPVNQNINSRMRMRRPFLARSLFTEKTELASELIYHCVKNKAVCRHPVDSIPVTIIIPLTGRSEAMHRFLDIFESLVTKESESLNLVIVDFPSKEAWNDVESFNRLKSDLYTLEKRLPNSRIELLRENGEFSRGKGLQIGGLSQGANELLFFCDIDMVLNAATIKRIRQETVKGKTAYYPVIFSKFEPDSTAKGGDFDLSEKEGFWREYGFGMVSLYQSDFATSGGFDMNLRGWGMEDVHLVTNFILRGKAIMRSNDPSLVHPWHPKECDLDLGHQQMNSCQRTKASHIGSIQWLYQKWLESI